MRLVLSSGAAAMSLKGCTHELEGGAPMNLKSGKAPCRRSRMSASHFWSVSVTRSTLPLWLTDLGSVNAALISAPAAFAAAMATCQGRAAC